MRVLRKEVTFEKNTFQPKLRVTLEFDLEYATDKNTELLDRDIGINLVKMITEAETTYPEPYTKSYYESEN